MDRLRWGVSQAKFVVRRAVKGFEPPTQPSLDGETLEALSGAMKAASSYLEYGTGGSTVMAAELVQGPVFAVESDRKYLDAVRKAIEPFGRSDISLHHADIGPVLMWGVPALRWTSGRWRSYPQAPWAAMQEAPDLIFVDGRFRVACVLECLLRLPADWRGQFILDDYDGRPHYEVLERFVDRPQRVGRALSFTRGAVDLAAVRKTIPEYYLDHR